MTVAVARRCSSVAATVALCGAAAGGALLVTFRTSPLLPLSGFVLLLTVPFMVALIHALLSLAGELFWPRARGEVRRARIRTRGLDDVVGRPMLVMHLIAVALFGATVALGALLDARDGVTFGWGWNERSGEFLGIVTNTTFPGARVTAPLVLAAAALLAATWATVLLALHHADVASAPRQQNVAMRRSVAWRVLRITTATFLITDGGLTVLAGAAVATSFRETWIGDLGTGVAYAGLVIAASALLFALPMRPRPSVVAEASRG